MAVVYVIDANRAKGVAKKVPAENFANSRQRTNARLGQQQPRPPALESSGCVPQMCTPGELKMAPRSRFRWRIRVGHAATPRATVPRVSRSIRFPKRETK